jgi:hypothetical protein
MQPPSRETGAAVLFIDLQGVWKIFLLGREQTNTKDDYF